MRVGLFFAYLRPFYPTWDRDLEKELVRQFDLPLDRKLRDLSRGMRVKAALASSLVDTQKIPTPHFVSRSGRGRNLRQPRLLSGKGLTLLFRRIDVVGRPLPLGR